MNIVFLIGIIQSLFFASILILKKNKSNSDKILCVWFLIISLHLLFPFFLYTDYPKHIYLSGTDSGLLVMHSIFLYIYSISLLSRNKRYKKRYALHFTIFIIANLLIIPYMLEDKNTKIDFYNNTANLSSLIWICFYIINLIFISYLFITIRQIQNHKKQLKNNFSYIEKMDLQWLKYMVIALSTIYIALTIIGSILYAIDITIFNIDYFIYVLIVLFVFGIGFFGIKQQNVFADINIQSYNDTNKSGEYKFTNQIKISNEDIEFTENLKKYMLSEKIYLKNDLSLFDLSKILNVKTHYISHILNNVLNTNFYEFVNLYRVEEMKNQLSKNVMNYTILGIALESGFNSKATANRIFKKYTGKTPSQYINSN